FVQQRVQLPRRNRRRRQRGILIRTRILRQADRANRLGGLNRQGRRDVGLLQVRGQLGQQFVLSRDFDQLEHARADRVAGSSPLAPFRRIEQQVGHHLGADRAAHPGQRVEQSLSLRWAGGSFAGGVR